MIPSPRLPHPHHLGHYGIAFDTTCIYGHIIKPMRTSQGCHKQLRLPYSVGGHIHRFKERRRIIKSQQSHRHNGIQQPRLEAQHKQERVVKVDSSAVGLLSRRAFLDPPI